MLTMDHVILSNHAGQGNPAAGFESTESMSHATRTALADALSGFLTLDSDSNPCESCGGSIETAGHDVCGSCLEHFRSVLEETDIPFNVYRT